MQSTTDYLPYVRRLQAEHGKIRRVVRRIPTECFGAKARRSARPPKSVLTESLIVLQGRLEHHFFEEEEGGCIEEAVSRRPSLAAEANKLESQHRVLLAHLSRIIDQVRRQRDPFDEAEQIEREFHDFARALLAHEGWENRILECGFNVSLGLDDTKGRIMKRLFFAALAFVDMTLKCVNFHKDVRCVRMARLDAPSDRLLTYKTYQEMAEVPR